MASDLLFYAAVVVIPALLIIGIAYFVIRASNQRYARESAEFVRQQNELRMRYRSSLNLSRPEFRREMGYPDRRADEDKRGASAVDVQEQVSFIATDSSSSYSSCSSDSGSDSGSSSCSGGGGD